jgi:putative ABC transport system permease protein
MISPLDLKLFRDIGKMKGQMVAVSVVMACGLAMMIMSRSLIHGTLDESLAVLAEAKRW